MRLNHLRLGILLALFMALLPVVAWCQPTVILVRHSEKETTPPKDPALTAAGQQRAVLLAGMLADSGVEAIYVTEFKRTQMTAAPLAARVHVPQVVLPAKDTAQLVKAIRAHTKGVVVVVGHSNTLPGIISALGGPNVEIADNQYDNLFLVTVGPAQSSLLRLHYGDTAPVPPQSNSMVPTPK